MSELKQFLNTYDGDEFTQERKKRSLERPSRTPLYILIGVVAVATGGLILLF